MRLINKMLINAMRTMNFGIPVVSLRQMLLAFNLSIAVKTETARSTKSSPIYVGTNCQFQYRFIRFTCKY